MKYKVIALDLDGTLTNHQKEVTPRTLRTLLQCIAEGVIVVLASGRPTFGMEPVADCLKLDKLGGYLLSYNGAKIVDWKTRHELYAKYLPDGVIPQIYDYAQAHGYALLGYDGNVIVTEKPDDEYVLEEARINKMKIRGVKYLPDCLEANPVKLLLTGDPEKMKLAEVELAEQLSGRMDVFRSAPFFVELVPKGIDKALSLQRLLAHLQLTPSDIIAFGDGYNDLTMLRMAGMGVAMGNAVPEVRAEADYITLSNEEDGIAEALTALM